MEDETGYEMRLGECHGHILMDGCSYKQAVSRHICRPDEKYVREVLESYRKQGILFFRDGGDSLGVTLFAKSIACEYGIDYRTPAFAIYKKGYYGAIVGEPFTDVSSYRELMKRAIDFGCDFIKIMVSGILSYDHYGEISCEPLGDDEITWMIAEAHDSGYAVMVHGNGDQCCRASILAGADSLEHGFLMQRETLDILAESDTVWVPTLSPAWGARGTGRFSREVLDKINSHQQENISYAVRRGAYVAAGSDAGARGVCHDAALATEVGLLGLCGIRIEDLQRSEEMIHSRFGQAGFVKRLTQSARKEVENE